MRAALLSAVRPPLALSTLPALNVDLLADGAGLWLVCPTCRRWCEAPGDRVQDHAPDGAWCTGSGRQVAVDLTVAQHAARRAVARAARARHAGLRSDTCGATAAPVLGAPPRVVRLAPTRTSMAAAFERAVARTPAAPAAARA